MQVADDAGHGVCHVHCCGPEILMPRQNQHFDRNQGPQKHVAAARTTTEFRGQHHRPGRHRVRQGSRRNAYFVPNEYYMHLHVKDRQDPVNVRKS
jgi:hypothetical protein